LRAFLANCTAAQTIRAYALVLDRLAAAAADPTPWPSGSIHEGAWQVSGVFCWPP
jgi:hypothetical protein